MAEIDVFQQTADLQASVRRLFRGAHVSPTQLAKYLNRAMDLLEAAVIENETLRRERD